MDPYPMPSLPFGQIGLMIYSWLTMGLYIAVIYVIIKKQNTISILQSSFFALICGNAIAEFFLFITIEFVQRPRKYRFLGVFTQIPPQSFAYFTCGCNLILKNAIVLGFLPFAFNRYTAFHFPIHHKQIWTRRNIKIIYSVIWIYSIFVSIPMLFCPDVKFAATTDGLLQLMGGWVDSYDTIEGLIVLGSVTSICLVLYVKTAVMTMCSGKRYGFRVERRLLLCSMLMFLSLIAETIRSGLKAYGIYCNNQDLIFFTTEAWYYVYETTCSVQCITLILLTPSIRKALMQYVKSPLIASSNKNSICSIVKQPIMVKVQTDERSSKESK